jgi:EmrB/QacA subfamily drug resistance transporter
MDNGNPRLALLCVALGSFTTPLMLSGVNVAVPHIAAELGGDAILISWIATAYLLSTAVFLLPAGKIADTVGRKRVYMIGLAVVLVSSVVAGTADSIGVLIGYRILQGMGTAMLYATSAAILSSVYPPQRRGAAIGVSVSMVYVGLTCGPLLGGWFVEHYSWRSVFYYYLPVVCASFLLMLKLDGEWTNEQRERFDLPGAASWGIAIIALMYGFSLLPSAFGLGLTAAGVMAFVVFLRVESGRRQPLLDVSLFLHNKVFRFSCLASLIMYSATFGNSYLMSLYLQSGRDLSAQSAGLVMLCQPLIMALLSPFAGRLSDRIEPRVLSSIGLAITASGQALLALLHAGTSLSYVVGALMLTGFGFALFSSPNISAIMGSVEKRHYGLASGVAATTRVIGQTLSMGVVTLVFAVLLGNVLLSEATQESLIGTINACFCITAMLCLPGVLFSLSRGRLR